MTLPIERARTRAPITWLTIIGVILLPVVIGGILVAALYNPVDRLGNMTAAIVNDDKPVTLNGQTVPLGRQLTAGLVEGSDELSSNLAWTITNADDAAAGLADGTYDAIVTIPENFSAAATSTAGDSPEKATIQVTTPPDSRIVDDAITAQVTQTAASLTGQQLSEAYLQNVLLGFTTLHDQLGQAADGATQLADGATQAADGAAQLPSGATALGSGATQLAAGAGRLATGLGQLQGAAASAADGAGQLASGVDTAVAQIQQQGLVPAQLVNGAKLTSDGAAAVAQMNAGIEGTLQGLVAACEASGSGIPADYCADVRQLADGLATQAVAASAGTAQGAAGVSTGTQALATQLPQALAGQLAPVATGAHDLSTGLGGIAGGIGQSQSGAVQLQSGASQLSSGADQLATGAQSLADGVGQLATGTASLADGLDTAVAQVPTYSDAQAKSLATVVADPVTTDGLGTSLFGASAIPLLATLALWFGGLASFVALRAVPARALASRRPSVLLALRALLPGALVGIVQGLLVAIVVQIAASYDAGTWALFALLAMLTGVAFAAINQALVAVLGGAGRWVAALVGVLVVATGVVSTVPSWLIGIAGLVPTGPAYTGMLGVLTSAGGTGAAVAGLVIWAVLAFVATILAVTVRRTTSARAVLRGAPA
jgi:putative membrane protein